MFASYVTYRMSMNVMTGAMLHLVDRRMSYDVLTHLPAISVMIGVSIDDRSRSTVAIDDEPFFATIAIL